MFFYSMSKQKIYFITGNDHKFTEVSDLFKKNLPNYELLQLKEDLLNIQAWTLELVAEFKVKNVRAVPDAPDFIEDAGFFFEDLKEFPGVYSAYVFKSIGYNGILKVMKGNPNRKSCFKSVIAFVDINKEIKTFVGQVDGTVSEEARGSEGFGFDPIFVPNEIPGKTFSEIPLEQKNKISHRSRSLKKFMEYLKTK